MAALDLKAKIAATPRGESYAVGQYLPLDQIRMDGGTQARAGLDNQTVAEYAESWLTLSHRQNGFLEMPLIIVYHDGKDYWLADGFHRVVAYRQFLDGGSSSASPKAIRAEVRQGTRRDAVLFACGANNTHGLRRTNADKRRAVETLLRDDEWKQWSNSEIARRCQVGHPLVAEVRQEIYPEDLQDSRTVTRAGTTYQQKPPTKPNISDQPMLPEMPAPASPADLPPEYAVVQRRFVPHGITLLSNIQGHERVFVTRKAGGTGVVRTWPDVLNALSLCEDGMEGLAPIAQQISADSAPAEQPKIPEVAPYTSETRDAAGPWFWASKSAVHPTAHCWHKSDLTSGYVSACGLAAPQQPTQGAKGVHCSVCEQHATRREIIPIPGSAPAITRAVCAINGCDGAGVGTHQLVPHGTWLWLCATHAPQIAELRRRGWWFPPAKDGWIRLTHPDLSYIRNERTIEDAIKAALELQAGYDRRDRLAAEQPNITAPLPRDLAPTIEALDATIPRSLSDAGFYWKAAQPPTIAHNDGWYRDAATVEAALNLAHDRAQENVEAKDRRLSPGQYVSVMDLIGKLRAAVITGALADVASRARHIAQIAESPEG